MKKAAITWIALAALLAPATAGAAPGDLDQTFGVGGKVVSSFASGTDAFALVLQPDGKVVAAGSAWNGTASEFVLARYDTGGALDAGFGTDGMVTTLVSADTTGASALVLQPDGKLVAAGTAWTDADYGDSDFALVRYNANGSLNLNFGSGGKVITPVGSSYDSVAALVLQPDGKLVAAGAAYNGTTTHDFALVRYNANGSLDTTFGTGGRVTTPVGIDSTGASALVLQPDGKLVAAGQASTGATYDFVLVRYNANGTLDASFGTGGAVTTPVGVGYDAVSSLVVQPDGKLVAAGYTATGATYAFALVRYHADGTLDAGFGVEGAVVTRVGVDRNYASALVLQPDGKLVAAGYTEPVDNDFALVRYNTDGSLDTTFGTGGKVITPIGSEYDGASSLVLQPDGKLVAAGYASGSAEDDFALVRYLGQVCGDGIISAPEPCDAGAAGGTAGACCTAACQPVTPGTICPGGLCDETGQCMSTTGTSTTTTTLPCPDGGFEAIACVLRAAARLPECAADRIPPAIRRRVGRATTFIDDGAAAASAVQARHLVQRAARRLKKAAHLAGNAGRVSAPCSRALTAMLGDAGSRAVRLAQTLGGTAAPGT